MVSTPYQLLRSELRRDGSRPLVTFYDDATGERVELSVATFDNWVAKTAGLLRDDLSADTGDRVAMLVPRHWQALVWAGACWALGCCVTDTLDAAAVVVVAPDALEEAATTRTAEVVALSLRPLGGRFTEPLPAGVLDYALEVPGHPDELVGYIPPSAGEPALELRGSGDRGAVEASEASAPGPARRRRSSMWGSSSDDDNVAGRDAGARESGDSLSPEPLSGAVHTLGGLVDHARERADQLGVAAASRLLVTGTDLRSAIVDALLVPLVVGGSAVLVRNEDASGRDGRVAAERVTKII